MLVHTDSVDSARAPCTCASGDASVCWFVHIERIASRGHRFLFIVFVCACDSGNGTHTNTHTHTRIHLEYFCFGFASSHADRVLSNLKQKKKKEDLVEGKRTHAHTCTAHIRRWHFVVVCMGESNSPKQFDSGLLVSKSKHATGISYTHTQANKQTFHFLIFFLNSFIPLFFPLFDYGTKRHRSHKIFQLFFNSMQCLSMCARTGTQCCICWQQWNSRANLFTLKTFDAREENRK